MKRACCKSGKHSVPALADMSSRQMVGSSDDAATLVLPGIWDVVMYPRCTGVGSCSVKSAVARVLGRVIPHLACRDAVKMTASASHLERGRQADGGRAMVTRAPCSGQVGSSSVFVHIGPYG